VTAQIALIESANAPSSPSLRGLNSAADLKPVEMV